MFFNKWQRLHEWKDTAYLYMYALSQVERFAVVDVEGQGREHSFVRNLGLLTAAKSRNFRWSGTDTIRSHILPSKPKRK